MEIISNSSDLSVWNLIKSRCPTPEINESRIKIGRTLIQENESLHEEKEALQSILYELYGDRLKKTIKSNDPNGERERGGGKRLFRDALNYSKLHYENDLIIDDNSSKNILNSPSRLKSIVKNSSSSSNSSIKTSKNINSITESTSYEDVIQILSTYSSFSLHSIEQFIHSIRFSIQIENKKLEELIESYRKILENGLEDITSKEKDYEKGKDSFIKTNNNQIEKESSSRGNSSNSKTRDKFRGVKEDIYFMDD